MTRKEAIQVLARLIDAEKIPYHKQLEAQGNGQYEDVEVAYKSEIDAVPSLKELYLVKHGKWESSEHAGEYLYTCSICGRSSLFETNFCPNCGAKMDEE